jgi:hypothetical protein
MTIIWAVITLTILAFVTVVAQIQLFKTAL